MCVTLKSYFIGIYAGWLLVQLHALIPNVWQNLHITCILIFWKHEERWKSIETPSRLIATNIIWIYILYCECVTAVFTIINVTIPEQNVYHVTLHCYTWGGTNIGLQKIDVRNSFRGVRNSICILKRRYRSNAAYRPACSSNSGRGNNPYHTRIIQYVFIIHTFWWAFFGIQGSREAVETVGPEIKNATGNLKLGKKKGIEERGLRKMNNIYSSAVLQSGAASQKRLAANRTKPCVTIRNILFHPRCTLDYYKWTLLYRVLLEKLTLGCSVNSVRL
jgi:hypothetical protein